MWRLWSLIGITLLVGCSDLEEPATELVESTSIPDQEIWNGQIEITSDGRRQSVVQAGHIEVFEKQKVTLFGDGVTVDFYNSAGEHTSVLTSQRARIEERADLFVALGDVIVSSDSGAVLRTERLFWDRTDRQVRSDTLVILTTELDSLRGFDFESNEDLSSWQLKNPTGQTFRKRP